MKELLLVLGGIALGIAGGVTAVCLYIGRAFR